MSYNSQIKDLGLEVRRYPRITLLVGAPVIFQTRHVRAAIREYSIHVGNDSKMSNRGFHEALTAYIKELEERLEMCRNNLDLAARVDVARGGTFAQKLKDEGVI